MRVLLKNLVHKGVNFEAQNALKLRASLISKKNSRGVIPPDYNPPDPIKRGRGRRGPPIHIPGYATELRFDKIMVI